MDQQYGPVINKIEEGHVEHGGKCVACSGGIKAITEQRGVPYPCAEMLSARKEQVRYADRLQQHRADAAGKLSPMVVG